MNKKEKECMRRWWKYGFEAGALWATSPALDVDRHPELIVITSIHYAHERRQAVSEMLVATYHADVGGSFCHTWKPTKLLEYLSNRGATRRA